MTPILVMPKHLRHAFWASLAVLMITLAYMAIAEVRREPDYKGRPLTYWFHQLPLTYIDSSILAQMKNPERPGISSPVSSSGG